MNEDRVGDLLEQTDAQTNATPLAMSTRLEEGGEEEVNAQQPVSPRQLREETRHLDVIAKRAVLAARRADVITAQAEAAHAAAELAAAERELGNNRY